jgi:enoyl-CoA hydratase/carnithine racemase
MNQLNIKPASRSLTRICTVEDGLAWITLDRPEKANAINSALLGDILEAMEAAEADPQVRAIIFSGAGQNFCAGADLAELLDGGPSAVRRVMNGFRAVCLKFERSPLPVVGMVQGAVRAGGLEFLLCCDAVVASEDATIGDGHALRDLLPGGGGSVRLPRTIGHQRAKWLMLSGSSISAAQARDWGILHAVAPKLKLREAAIDLAHQISVSHRDTIGRAKALLMAAHDLPLEEGLENEIVTLETHFVTPAVQTGLRRFLRR